MTVSSRAACPLLHLAVVGLAQTKSRNTYSLAQTVRPRAGILNSGTSWCSCDFCSEPFLKCNAYNFIFSLGNIDLTAVCTKKPCTASCWFPCHAPARLGLRRAQRRRLAVPRKLTVLCFGGGRKPPPFPPDVHPGTFREGRVPKLRFPIPGPGPRLGPGLGKLRFLFAIYVSSRGCAKGGRWPVFLHTASKQAPIPRGTAPLSIVARC